MKERLSLAIAVFHFSLEVPSWVVHHGLSCYVDMFEGY